MVKHGSVVSQFLKSQCIFTRGVCVCVSECEYEGLGMRPTKEGLADTSETVSSLFFFIHIIAVNS